MPLPICKSKGMAEPYATEDSPSTIIFSAPAPEISNGCLMTAAFKVSSGVAKVLSSFICQSSGSDWPSAGATGTGTPSSPTVAKYTPASVNQRAWALALTVMGSSAASAVAGNKLSTIHRANRRPKIRLFIVFSFTKLFGVFAFHFAFSFSNSCLASTPCRLFIYINVYAIL